MKMWQKIYAVVLIISMLFVNVGIYAVFQLTYEKNIETEQNRGEVDYTVISRSITKNMQALEEQNRLSEDAAVDLMKIYEEEYAGQKVRIQLWKNQRQLYPDKEEKEPYALGDGEIHIHIQGKRQEKSLTAAGKLPGFPDVYDLYIEYPLEELNAIWGRLYQIYLIISFAISLVLACFLSVLLHFLLRPLKRLTESVSDIRQGDYSSRVEIKGRDELASLGENINIMAKTIEANIQVLKEDNQKKEQLVDNLAHEMKSPLTSIYGFAEYLLKGRVDPEEAIECYSFIMEESQRMTEMCYVLMDLSEIRHKKIQFESFRADEFVSHLKRAAARQQRGFLDEKRIELQWQSELPENASLYGNPNLLEMLVLNLVTNAVRASWQKKEEGKEPTVYIRLKQIDGGRRRFSLSVKDEGTGIPEEKLKHITEPFYRVDKGRSREAGGNGLGLALCRQIVELHQGTLTFSSMEGKGTEVTACLWNHEKFTV